MRSQEAHKEITETKSELKVDSIRARMTSTVTYYMAAQIIAKPDFPQKDDLPNLCPPAFNNFGHQLLMDYKLLLSIIWEVIEDIKSSIRANQSAKLPWRVGSVITAGGFLFLGIASQSIILIIAAFIIPFIIYGIGARRVNSALRKEIAGIRAKAIEELINGEWGSKSSSLSKTIEDELKQQIGDGNLGGDKIPVIIMRNNKHPFPGYGRLQAENLFICRPEEEKKKKEMSDSPTIDEIREVVSKRIADRVLSSGIEEVTLGEIVVIHSSSLLIDSKWLDEEKVPILWIDKSQQLMDPEVSARRFFAVQVLFPEYLTAATFFVRLFWAGNAAACQVAVTTLGPPIVDKEYFLRRLLKYKMEKEGTDKSVGQATYTSEDVREEEREEIARLRLVHILTQSETPFQSDSINIGEIDKLNVLNEKAARQSETYKQEYEEIIKENVMWPGRFFSCLNWRENNSLTFPTDFFGRPEAIATVRTLYDQISRAILNSLSDLGFDISDYHDRISIMVEKLVGDIVLGETVIIGKSAVPEKPERIEAPSRIRIREQERVQEGVP